MNIDRMSYLVFEADSQGVVYLAEREWADMDRKTTIDDIASGQFEFLVTVIEFNAAENTSRDVTEDFAKAVMTIWASRGDPLTDTEFEFIEFHLGSSMAHQFPRQAAE